MKLGWRNLKDSHVVLGFGAALGMAIVLASLAAALSLRAAETEVWKKQVNSITTYLAENVFQTTSSAYLALDSIVDRVRAAGAVDEADLRRKMSTQDVFQMLRDKTGPLPQIDVATVVAANGDVINFTRSHPPPSINLSDRDYFKEHRDNPTAGNFISVPVKNKGNGKWVFYISRRLNDPQGKFMGLVIVGISVAGTAEFYQRVGEGLGDGAAINLFRRDFTLLTRWPPAEELIGKQNTKGTTFDIIQQQGLNAGVMVSATPRFINPDQPAQRMGGARLVNRYPLVVGVTITDDFYLANWRKSLQALLAFALFGCLLVGAGTILLTRMLRQREAAHALTIQLKREAEAANEAKSSFIAVMSHEIRTPLTCVLGITELLGTTKLDEQQTEFVHMVTRSGSQLNTIVNDILDFSKVEAGRMDIEALPFETRLLVSDVTSIFRSNAERKGIALGASVAADVPVAMVGDPSRLRQILANYLNNAVKFTEAGHIDLSLTVREAVDGAGTRRLHFAVTDTGIGIADDVKPALFMPFKQADSSVTRKYGGTGLGLAICRKFAELMGGTVGVESKPGAGSTFWLDIALPVSVDSIAEPTPAANGAEEAAPRAKLGPQHHLLIVEDNPTLQLLATGIIERTGCRTDVAADGREAVAAVDKQAYSLILMDCMMPGMDGYEAAKRIRLREDALRLPRVPIVAVTANASTDDAIKCRQAGMDDYLAKPYTAEALCAAIRKWSKIAGAA